MDKRPDVLARHFHLSRLRTAFDRRAPHLHAVDFFLREVAQRMYTHLEALKITPKRIVDMGCATGCDFSTLQKKFPHAQLFGVDWSWPMLWQARQQSLITQLKQYLSGQRLHLIQADWLRLPIAQNSIDFIWSNLALHWSASPQKVFEQWAPILRPDGLLLCSTLGPDSLKELRHAFKEIKTHISVPAFFDMHDLGDMLISQGFSDPVVDAEILTITYESPQSLLHDVRALGIYPGIDFQPSLRGKAWLQRLYTALEAQRDSTGVIRLTIELIYIHAWKLATPIGQIDKTGIARLRPEDIGRPNKH